MRFFRPPRSLTSANRAKLAEDDQIILSAGQNADRAMLDCFTQSAAFWATYRLEETEKLDREHPGYRDALNQRRATSGLPPV